MTQEREAVPVKSKLLPIGSLVIAALLIYAGISLARTMDSLRDAEEMTGLLKKDIEVAQNEIRELDAQLENSGSDEFYEQIARDRLGLVKQGEIIFIDNYR